MLKRQAGVAFAPKDLRSSFITFLLSDANSDEVLKKAVAHAMRHSPAQQGSTAYDKERADRTWAAAVQVSHGTATRPFSRRCAGRAGAGAPTHRVHSGLPPREDHASDLVGAMLDAIGLSGWCRWFRRCYTYDSKGATRRPGMLHRASQGSRSRGARPARTSSQKRARAGRVLEGV